MIGSTDEDRPRTPVARHEIGQSLDTLSVDDLDARLALLEREIDRLREARASRDASRRAASAAFKS